MADKKPDQQTYMALHQPLLAMTTLGVLAEEGSRHIGDLIRQGPQGKRIAAKLAPYAAAAYWREASAAWVEEHPQAEVVWGEGSKDGWPEFLAQGRFHVIPHRNTDFKKSARQKALDFGGPDPYMSFTLPALSIEDLQPAAHQDEILVRLFAVRDEDDFMIGTRAVAPFGQDVRWAFEITAEEVRRQQTEWLFSEAPWVEDVNILGSLTLPGAVAPPVAPRPAAIAGTGDVAADSEGQHSLASGSPRSPYFEKGPDTQVPPNTERTAEDGAGDSSSTGTER